MTDTQIVELGLQAMTIAAKMCAPVLVTALLIGFAISLFQSVTEVVRAFCQPLLPMSTRAPRLPAPSPG